MGDRDSEKSKNLKLEKEVENIDKNNSDISDQSKILSKNNIDLHESQSLTINEISDDSSFFTSDHKLKYEKKEICNHTDNKIAQNVDEKDKGHMLDPDPDKCLNENRIDFNE